MRKITTYFYLFSVVIITLIISNRIVIEQTTNQIYEKTEDVPFKEYTLVLGTSKEGKLGINPYFKYRMDAAISLYNSGKTSKIIVSGDNHKHSYNETADMVNYLVNNGIPKSGIIADYAGFRTLDSVVRAKKVFNCQSLIIVSQEFHNQRALYIANFYGMDAVAFNARDVSTNNYTHFREYLAKVLVILDLYVFQTAPKFL